MNIKNFRVRAVSTLIGAFIINMTIGGVFWALGVMNPYISSYHLIKSKYNGTDLADEEWIGSVHTASWGVFFIFGSLISNRIGHKYTISIGSCLITLFTALTYFALQLHISATILCYGLMTGLGVGLSYLQVMNLCQQHYPDHMGLVSGFALTGEGLGVIIYGPLLSGYINLQNKSPNILYNHILYFGQNDVLERVPSSFLIIATLFGCFCIVGVLLLKEPSSNLESLDQKISLLNSDTTSLNSNSTAIIYSDANIITFEESICQLKKTTKDRNFIIIGFLLFFLPIYIALVNNNWKEYGQLYISNDKLFGFLSILFGIANATGRIVCGILTDRCKFKTFNIVLQFIFLVLLATFPLFTLIHNESAQIAFFTISVFGQIFIMSGLYSVYPAVIANFYGVEYMPINYGFLIIFVTISSLLSNVLLIVVFSLGGGMFAVWELMAVLNLIVLIISFFVKT